jgi:hypothetical protein
VAYTRGLLADGVRLLVYSGEFDGQIPTAGTERWTRSVGLAPRAASGGWRPWFAGSRGGGAGAGGAGGAERAGGVAEVGAAGAASAFGSGGGPAGRGPVSGSVVEFDSGTGTEFTLLTIRGAGHMAPR